MRSDKPSTPGREKSECRSTSDDVGEPARGTQPSKGRHRERGTVGGKDGRDSELTNHLDETSTDSGSGAASSRAGVHDARPSHRHRLAARGVPTHAQGRSDRHRRTDERGVRREPGGQPPVAARPLQVRRLPSAPRPSRAHPEGRWVANAPHRHSNLRGQGAATRSRDVAGGHLRAGLHGLLVRLPTEPLGASRARGGEGRNDAGGRRLGLGGRHQEVFRHPRSRMPSRDRRPQGT